MNPLNKLLCSVAKFIHHPKDLEPYPGWYYSIGKHRRNPFNKLRSFLWEYFRDRECDCSFTVPIFNGLRFNMVLGNAISRALYIDGRYEPNELFFMKQFLEPGMNVIDIGANEGLYSLLAAKITKKEGTVFGFEPEPLSRERFQKNVEINDLKNIKIFGQGLMDQKGEAELKIANPQHSGQNVVSFQSISDQENNFVDELTINLTTLDHFYEKQGHPDIQFIKIDAEGSELHILQGGENLIDSEQPVFQIEINPEHLEKHNSSKKDILEFFHQKNYSLFQFDDEGKATKKIKRNIPQENLIAAKDNFKTGQLYK